MAVNSDDANAPEFVRRYVNLADARLGAVALQASDEFFADKQRLLDPEPAQFIPGKYDSNGKWMDGWETRRKRGPGHDWCIVRLARPGHIHGIDLDTRHFIGNYPPAAAVDGCYLEGGASHSASAWLPLVPPVNLGPDQHHYLPVTSAPLCSHLRINLYPDGGLARLRVYATPLFDHSAEPDGRFDLGAALQGGVVVASNNEHFGRASNLLLPGRGADMGDGWETRRRREPGNDWCIIALARPGIIEEIEVDTGHFKGNYPDRCSLQAAHAVGGTRESVVTQSMFWPPLLAEQSLQMDHQHFFNSEIREHAEVSHIRFNIIPDGGVSRLRLRGRPA